MTNNFSQPSYTIAAKNIIFTIKKTSIILTTLFMNAKIRQIPTDKLTGFLVSGITMGSMVNSLKENKRLINKHFLVITSS